MESDPTSIVRLLELENEARSQELAIAYQRIASLEDQVNALLGPIDGSVDPSVESPIDFIRRVAESRTKFAKEAQDIIDAIDNPPNGEPI